MKEKKNNERMTRNIRMKRSIKWKIMKEMEWNKRKEKTEIMKKHERINRNKEWIG